MGRGCIVNVSGRAWLYIWTILLSGGLVSGWLFLQALDQLGGLLLAVSVGAALVKIFPVAGPQGTTTYDLSWVAYGFALVVLGPAAAVAVVWVAHLAGWTTCWRRCPWYVPAFNLASYALVVSVVGGVSAEVITLSLPLPPQLREVLVLVLAAVLFAALSHLSVGVVVRLVQKQPFALSGIFAGLPLMIEGTLFELGTLAGMLWQHNPYAVILALIPLYLLFHVLTVPALERQTQIEPKTGLFNARYFNEALAKELARAQRSNHSLAVVVADLDWLRTINNTYGHLAGDTVITGIASLLRCSVRDSDVVARFGGEEFAILMPDTSLADALDRVEGARARIAEAHFVVPTSSTPIKATMSFGVAVRELGGQTAQALLHAADQAVYQAKARGRNQVCAYQPDTLNVAGSL